MKHYIYKTTNTLTNKIYIGYHHSDDIENDKYLGSGDAIMRAVRQYGKDNFIREILFEFDNQDDAYTKERELVNENFVKNRDTYNITIGGRGWEIGNEPHNKGKITIYSPKTNKNYYVNENKLQKFLDDGYIIGNLSIKNKISIKKDENIKFIDKNELDNYINNGWIRSNTTDGKICITHIETNVLKYVNESDINTYLQNGYILGNLRSGVNKGKIYISKDGKNKRINRNDLDNFIKLGWVEKRVQKEINVKRMRHPETGKVKNVPIVLIDEYVNNGWIFGSGYAPNKNRIYITKDKKNKRIKKEDLSLFLTDGWVKGMYNSKYN